MTKTQGVVVAAGIFSMWTATAVFAQGHGWLGAGVVALASAASWLVLRRLP